jgi:hypothetical protein
VADALVDYSTTAELAAGADATVAAQVESGPLTGAALDAGVAGLVGDAGSDTAGALNAAYEAQMAKPASAGRAARATVPQLRTLALGDSIAYLKWRFMFDRLSRAYGYVTGGTAPGIVIESGQTGTGWVLPGVTFNAGTSTEVTTAFDAWFSGRVAAFTGGQYREYGQGGAAAVWDSVKVYYATGPTSADDGTFKITVAGVDEPGHTSVSTVAAEQNIGIATITYGTVESRTLRITNLTGNTRIVGIGFFASTSPGAIRAGIAQGGISLDSALTAGAKRALTTFIEDYDPDVVTLEMKEAAATFAANLAVLLPLARAAAPLALIVGIGSTPVASGDADQVTQNAQLRAACAAADCTYWDGYSPVVNYATLNALGWAGDGIHVEDGASAFLAGLMLDDLHLLDHPQLWNSRNVNAPIVSGGQIGVGTLAPTALIDVASSGNPVMKIRTTGTTGQTAQLDLQSGFSSVTGDAAIKADGSALRILGPTVGGTSSRVTIESQGAERVRVNSTGLILGGSTGPLIATGSATPEGSKTAPVGSLYLRTGGGAGTTLYVKETGTGNTGWRAV